MEAARAVGSNFTVKTWGPFYGLLSYVDKWTIPVYEMVSPATLLTSVLTSSPATLPTVLAYGDTQKNNLALKGYSLSRIAFYAPAVK